MHRLTTSLPFLLNKAGVRMGELFTQQLQAYGITLHMYRVLAALSERSDLRLSDLQEMTCIELSTLSRLVRAMKHRALITSDRPENDARTVRINLTDHGHALSEKLMPQAEAYENALTRTFSEEEIAALKVNLMRLYENMTTLDC